MFGLSVFLFLSCFFPLTFTIHRTAEVGDAITLTPLYHLHPLRRHLDIRQ